MSRLVLSVACVSLGCAVLLPARLNAADEQLEALEEQSFRQAAALASPSLVRVQTVGGLEQVGELLTGTGPTTGVVISADGFIVSSAFNFASKPSSILVQLPDGRRFPATLVATDRSRMISLLKVEAADLVPLQPANFESVRVGQWALALGRTFDNEVPSVSVGIVSALNRIWGRALQTDAKISPVNYGGPLVNVEGKVLGILVPLSQGEREETAGVEWYDSGIGFAIPMPDVMSSVERLKAGKDLHAGLAGLTLKQGVLDAPAEIDRVRPRSPAAEGGLKPGDIIEEIDGKLVRRQSDVQQALGRKYADETIAVAIKRGDEKLRLEVKLVAELTAFESAFLGVLPERPKAEAQPTGVGIRFVIPQSPAAKAGFKSGDRIVQFGETKVTTSRALRDLVSRLRPEEAAKIISVRDGAETTSEVTLSAIPNDVLKEVPTAATDPAVAKPEKPLQTGRFSVDMPNHGHSYWAYVPDDYNPAYSYSVMVWIHPTGDTMEASILKEWKSICDTRGILIIAPKAEKVSGWELNEGEFIKDAFDDFCGKYTVDRSRVFLHSYSTAGPFAFHLGFRFRDRFSSVAIAAAPFRGLPPENDPEHPLQFYLVCGDQDQIYPAVEKTVEMFRELKFPTAFNSIKDGTESYPAAPHIDEMARWADCLDRI